MLEKLGRGDGLVWLVPVKLSTNEEKEMGPSISPGRSMHIYMYTLNSMPILEGEYCCEVVNIHKFNQ